MTFSGGMLWWTLLGALLGWVGAWWLGRSTQRLLTEPVVRIVERQLDNPQHLMRIQHLDSELMAARAEAAAQRARADELAAAPPQVVEKVITRTVEKPVDRIVEKYLDRVVEKPVERIVEKTVERVVPDLAAIAERDAALRARQLRMEHLEALSAVQAERLAEVRAAALADLRSGTPAGTAPMHAAPAARDTDIEVVEGIGPKIAELLRARGLGSFGALADASPGTLREILAHSGPAYRIADPSTWPEQARLAADGRWDELRRLQEALTAGRRPGTKGDLA
ncbi:MAG: hypothetical protein WCK28_09165 [Burkholderiales bacterium]